MSGIRISFSYDQGPRENLEDALGVFTISIPFPGRPEITLAIAADGVGGNNYGEIASNLAVNSIKSFLAASLSVISFNPDGTIVPSTITDLLIDALNAANDAICRQAVEQPILKGMSTTIVCTLIINGVLYTAWAGDSRCYLFSNNKLRQITVDHSVVQQLINEGLLEPEHAKFHPLAHTINQFLGMKEGFSPETASCKLSSDDIVILCSDGLTDVLDDKDIADFVRKYQKRDLSFKSLPQHLARHAIACGTTDNVTVLCCEYTASHVKKSKPSFSLTGAYPARIAQTLQYLNKESDNA